MFTGLVQAVGTVEERRPEEGGLAFRVRAAGFASGLGEGESVAVDGVCQTVTARDGTSFAFQSVRTTLSRTTLGELVPGRRVNLERALRADDRLGGHLVQGHVDGVAEVREVEPAGETVYLRVRLPAAVTEVTVEYGSLTVDGVSLTVNALRQDVAELAVIPYTWNRTNLARLGAGDRVNVEADLVGKYVRKLLRPYLAGR